VTEDLGDGDLVKCHKMTNQMNERDFLVDPNLVAADPTDSERVRVVTGDMGADLLTLKHRVAVLIPSEFDGSVSSHDVMITDIRPSSVEDVPAPNLRDPDVDLVGTVGTVNNDLGDLQAGAAGFEMTADASAETDSNILFTTV